MELYNNCIDDHENDDIIHINTDNENNSNKFEKPWQFHVIITSKNLVSQQNIGAKHACYVGNTRPIGKELRNFDDFLNVTTSIEIEKIDEGILALFSDGIKPEWEDPANKDAQIYSFNYNGNNLNKVESVRFLTWLFSALVLSKLPFYQYINGLYVKFNGNGEVSVRFWTKGDAIKDFGIELTKRLKILFYVAYKIKSELFFNYLANNFQLDQKVQRRKMSSASQSKKTYDNSHQSKRSYYSSRKDFSGTKSRSAFIKN